MNLYKWTRATNELTPNTDLLLYGRTIVDLSDYLYESLEQTFRINFEARAVDGVVDLASMHNVVVVPNGVPNGINTDDLLLLFPEVLKSNDSGRYVLFGEYQGTRTFDELPPVEVLEGALCKIIVSLDGSCPDAMTYNEAMAKIDGFDCFRHFLEWTQQKFKTVTELFLALFVEVFFNEEVGKYFEEGSPKKLLYAIDYVLRKAELICKRRELQNDLVKLVDYYEEYAQFGRAAIRMNWKGIAELYLTGIRRQYARSIGVTGLREDVRQYAVFQKMIEDGLIKENPLDLNQSIEEHTRMGFLANLRERYTTARELIGLVNESIKRGSADDFVELVAFIDELFFEASEENGETCFGLAESVLTLPNASLHVGRNDRYALEYLLYEAFRQRFGDDEALRKAIDIAL